ncbi:PREDICTED: butyrophilin subfamily 3 member A2-like [Calidris pugnax]|uniref:butyrophilin subfamily 3 member A2-like n=1 Tax=Calidris pugnax TaxID=198806 RepID=UPI00071CF115|nr:PREDICTED: butyrophilin subfamily 3 member A2-like [Calidris pugnax]
MHKLRPQVGFPTSPWGLLRHFLTLHLLRLGSAEFRVVGPGQPLLATVGQDVVLPCHLFPGMDARSLEIRWIRHQVSETVHLYRNGADQHWDQMEEYAGRTELARDGLSSGSLDLRISGLRPSDDGQYVCTVQDAASYGEAVVELKVAAMGSVPLLSLEAYEDGGIRVVCRSAGWYPSPQVLWKDAGGQHLPSVSQGRSPDARGLFEIQDVIVVSGKGDVNVSCVVRNSRLVREQVSSLHISAPFFHNTLPWMAALGVLLLLIVMLFGVIAYLFQRKAKREHGQDKTANGIFHPTDVLLGIEMGAPGGLGPSLAAGDRLGNQSSGKKNSLVAPDLMPGGQGPAVALTTIYAEPVRPPRSGPGGHRTGPGPRWYWVLLGAGWVGTGFLAGVVVWLLQRCGPRACQLCPMGWQPFATKCYWVSTKTKAWKMAAENCQHKGAQLVILESLEEKAFIEGMMGNASVAWTGLRKHQGRETEWTWEDGSPLQKAL